MDCPALQGASNVSSYGHHSNISEMQNAITSIIEDSLNNIIERSPYFSIMVDESTDVSVSKN